MVQAPCQRLTLEEFLQLPETKPASEYVDAQLPVPSFASRLKLTVSDLFAWLWE
jgi:hypothetical protein